MVPAAYSVTEELEIGARLPSTSPLGELGVGVAEGVGVGVRVGVGG